jgi:hypothetical protein
MLLRSKRATVPAIAIALTLLAGGNALAHVDGYSRLHDDGAIDSAKETHGHDQHGGDEGHLPAGSSNVSLVSKLGLKNVSPGKIADVGVHNGYAYLAAWGGVTCKYNGVHVVDVRNVAAPREVAFIQSKEGSYPGEGVQALSISTPAFTGDILVTNNESCKDPAGFGGMNIYDVTDPAHPTPLAVGIGDETLPGIRKKAANEIHSVFAWDAGDKAYAVIVDNEEAKDVDILDITNPKQPKFIAEFNLAEMFPQILQASPANLTEVFLHDMVVKKIGDHFFMLLSYWDAGYIVLNVDNPTAPTYVADSDYNNPDPEALESGLTVKPEGNGHQAEFSKSNDFIVATDEDFSPYSLTARNVTDGTEFAASLGSDTPGITPGDTLSGHTMFIGRACNGDPGLQAPPAADGWIAVVERGLCTFTEKVANVEASGAWDAVIVMNREGDDACTQVVGMSVEGNIPAIGVSRPTGFDLFDTPYDDAACRDATPELAPIAFGTVGDDVEFESEFDGWGYVHLYSNNEGKLTELDTYAVPEAHDPAFAEGFGALSVHEVAMSHQRNELAYFAYYAAGFRVAAIEGGELVEKGHFIDEGGNDFWGVQVFESGGQEYVAASDRDFGLYIFKYNG